MARKIKRIGNLPQLPQEILRGGASAGGGTSSQYNPVYDYEVRLSRALFDWKLALEALIDDTNTGGSTLIIQDEGVDLPVEGKLNFIGTNVTATDDPGNGRTNVTITGGGGNNPPSGEHLLLLGAIDAAQDAADTALGFAGANTFVQIAGSLWLFGTGLDGVVHFDGVNTFSFATLSGTTYLLKRSVHATNCTVDAGIDVIYYDGQSVFPVGPYGGMQIFCTGTYLNNGHVNGDGTRNTVNLKNGGVSAAVENGIYREGGNGGSGGTLAQNGVAGTSVTNSFGARGGTGGTSSDGHTGGAAGTYAAPDGPTTGAPYVIYFPWVMIQGRISISGGNQNAPFFGGSGGGGGGGVAGVADGGGGGAGGNCLLISARFIATGSGATSCDGANGNSPAIAGGGGGGGGGGGLLMIITTTLDYATRQTFRAAAGGGGIKVGGIGNDGVAGTAGQVVAVVVTL